MRENVPPPLVSVALITYNHAEFIEECLDSILAQSYPNIEIVVADDASSDGTQDIIRRYAEKWPDRFNLRLSEVNQGVTNNHNSAFFACRGEYISWMSGDDLMLPGKIEKQAAYLENHPDCVVCYHDLDIFDTVTGKTLALKSNVDRPLEGEVDRIIKFGCFNGGVSNMVRRLSAPPHGFDARIPIASDWLFWVETLLVGGRIGYIDEVLARHRRHDNNITSASVRKPSLSEIQDHLSSSDIILSRAPEFCRQVSYRRSFLLSSLRWCEEGKSYNHYLRASLREHFRWKIFAGLMASRLLGIRR
jgi:glycosyltransferase involved in cell wall biosynthesis